MKNRAVKLTHQDFRAAALRKLGSILLDNSYPEKFINKLLFSSQYDIPENIFERQPYSLHTQSTINQTLLQKGHSQTTTIFNQFFSLPYTERLTEKLCNVVKQLDIKIARKQIKPLSLIYSKTKMPLAKNETYNVVYKVPCEHCNLSYVGQTSRSLKGRLTSHKSDCRTNKQTCALAGHFTLLGHDFD